MARKSRTPQGRGPTRSADDKRLMAEVGKWIDAQYQAWTVRQSEHLKRELGHVPANELSWSAFATSIGIGASSLSHYRRSVRVPSADAALVLARLDRGILDILGISEDDLAVAALVDRWGRLSPEAKVRIREIAGIGQLVPDPEGDTQQSQSTSGGGDNGESSAGDAARSARHRGKMADVER